MSQASDLIAAAVTANQQTGVTLQKLQVDQATADAAIGTQTQHAADAATQATQDAAAVNAAKASIASDLQAVEQSQTAQASALSALSALTPAPAPVPNPPAA